jgi:NAD+-dependent protein deacetylase sirtuin 4
MQQQLDTIHHLVAGRRIAILTGAGISTDSGIPDYRGAETRRRARHPIRYQEFVRDEDARRRYWARSLVGWMRFSRAKPNDAHRALGRMEAAGFVSGLVTQNVDRLHHKGGSSDIVELHGALAEVCCLECGLLEDRSQLQRRMLEANQDFPIRSAEMAPDGDAEIPAEATASFRPPECLACGGTLKPHVVFFGENVPRHRVERARVAVDAADVLLVAGTSLAVYSGYRFALHASRLNKPLVIINLGETRADGLATIKCELPLGEVLPALSDRLLC